MRLWTFCVVLLLSHISVVGQTQITGLPAIVHFDKSIYGAGNENEDLVQDENGILYIANNDGLLIYDGLNWNKINLPNRTRVRSVALNNNQRVFVGGQGEFGYLAPDSLNRLSYHSYSDLVNPEDQFLADIWEIFPYGEQVIFLAGHQLLIYEGDSIRVIYTDNLFRKGFVVRGSLYIQESGVGLRRWNGTQLEIASSNSLFIQDEIAFVETVGEEELLVGMHTSGIYRGNLSRLSKVEIPELANTKLASGMLLPDGSALVGTVNQGLIVFDTTWNVSYELNKKTGLEILSVHALRKDLSGQIWLASDNGLSLIDVNSPITTLDKRLGAEGAGFSSAKAPDGKLLLGTSQGVYYRPSDENYFSQFMGTEGTIWYMNVINENTWMGTSVGGLRYSNGTLQSFSSTLGAWDFVKLSDRNTVLAGNYTGMHVFAKDGSDQWKLSAQVANIDESTRGLVRENDSTFWMSHPYKGLYRIRLASDLSRATSIKTFGKDHGLPDDIRLFVFQIKGQLIFTSPDGVFEYDADSSKFRRCAWFEKIVGTHTAISKLYEDGRGNIWFVDDGQPGFILHREFKEPEVVIAPFLKLKDKMIPSFEHFYALEDQMIIGLQSGYACYYYSQPLQIVDSFPVTIRRVEKPGQQTELIYGGFGTVKESYVFPFQNNGIKFSYAATDFGSSGTLQYRYRLKGFDQDWSDWSSDRYNEYTNLPQGDYAFSVQAKNIYGIVSESSPWKFAILPPWYRTVWAYFSFAICFLLGIYGLVKIITAYKIQDLKHKQMQDSQVIIRLENEVLEQENAHNAKQLATMAFHLSQKENGFVQLKKELESAIENPVNLKDQIQKIIHTIDHEITLQEDWDVFERHFDRVHNNFMTRLRTQYPELSPIQNKLCAYLRMNLSSKEIAELMNISVAGVEKNRYRLRKKLNLASDDNLKEFIFQI